MSHVICVDGLGGVPEVTFSKLRLALEKAKHTVHYVMTGDVISHEDRIDRVHRTILAVRREYPHDKFFLIGQSAGGSAVRCAIALLSDENLPHGIILLSSAMPSGIWYATTTLMRIMLRYGVRLFGNQPILLTDKELVDLLAPLPEGCEKKIPGSQVEIATAEARKLAFFPDPLQEIPRNCAIIYGDKDRWVRPRAQEILARRIREQCRDARNKVVVTTTRISGAGHLTLLHGEAISEICRLIY